MRPAEFCTLIGGAMGWVEEALGTMRSHFLQSASDNVCHLFNWVQASIPASIRAYFISRHIPRRPIWPPTKIRMASVKQGKVTPITRCPCLRWRSMRPSPSLSLKWIAIGKPPQKQKITISRMSRTQGSHQNRMINYHRRPNFSSSRRS